MSEAFNFISKRKQPLSLRQKNIQNILWYFLECYNLVLTDGKTYSISEINKGKKKLENYLRDKLVDEYLREHTHLLQDRFKTEYIFFDKDSEETYIGKEGYECTDKIDIYIRDKALQECWSGERNIYFAVECKRIEILSDTQKYIDEDTIGKFIERKHIGFRLPFEGQLAFIHQNKNTPLVVAEEINKRLSDNSNTKNLLLPIKLHGTQDCSFISNHTRAYEKHEPFSIYHLLLDYSQIIIN
jgi:hypothetical protein